MSVLRVATKDALLFRGKRYRCAIGKGGFSDAKHEGDGCTPIGTFPLRECWYRKDGIAPPKTGLPVRIIQPDDGWCDAPEDANYNKHVKLPYAASHEKLWRDDHVYDLIIPIGYNDAPVVPGKGSAIFLHLAKSDYAPTEGCVAMFLPDWREILPYLTPETRIDISPLSR